MKLKMTMLALALYSCTMVSDHIVSAWRVSRSSCGLVAVSSRSRRTSISSLDSDMSLNLDRVVKDARRAVLVLLREASVGLASCPMFCFNFNSKLSAPFLFHHTLYSTCLVIIILLLKSEELRVCSFGSKKSHSPSINWGWDKTSFDTVLELIFVFFYVESPWALNTEDGETAVSCNTTLLCIVRCPSIPSLPFLYFPSIVLLRTGRFCHSSGDCLVWMMLLYLSLCLSLSLSFTSCLNHINTSHIFASNLPSKVKQDIIPSYLLFVLLLLL